MVKAHEAGAQRRWGVEVLGVLLLLVVVVVMVIGCWRRHGCAITLTFYTTASPFITRW